VEGKRDITAYFAEVETNREHNGYYFSVGEALTVVTLGTLCGLRNTNQIHQWAESPKVGALLERHFGIRKVPCYYWLLTLLSIVEPESLNRCFMNWAQSLLPEGAKGLTISFDGKTIRSTGRMAKSKAPLHIISAHVGELGLTLAQNAVGGKGSEIPAMRELLEMLDAEGCLVVADALHCQRETAAAVVRKGADYLLSVKDNQPALKRDVEEYVQDEVLRRGMETSATVEKNGGRLERRTAFVSGEVGWLDPEGKWAGLASFGAIRAQFTTARGESDRWHYYISSRKLTAEELLRRARLEWSVESMHWLLDVHFGEDFCRAEDANAQRSLNMVRKIALNCVKTYKRKSGSRRPLSSIMLGCLLDCDSLIPILLAAEN